MNEQDGSWARFGDCLQSLTDFAGQADAAVCRIENFLPPDGDGPAYIILRFPGGQLVALTVSMDAFDRNTGNVFVPSAAYGQYGEEISLFPFSNPARAITDLFENNQ